jgi:ATP-dependent DNA helicase PIF1
MHKRFETELLNQVQRHTKCTKTTCLCMKASKLQCRYNCPWTLQSNSSLFIDASGKKKYEPARNDDRLNIHNPDILTIWRENMDCQPILSRHAVMKYISKYASKAEGRSESYHHMLTRITDTLSPTDPASFAYRRLHTKAIVDRDIGTQETCHMLQKLPLVTCSRLFMTLNVGHHIFRRVSKDPSDCLSVSTFIDAYVTRPPCLQPLPLIEIAKYWSYSRHRKSNPWRRRSSPVIVLIWPRFTVIPTPDSKSFEEFCWSELLLYKPFSNFATDIGLSRDTIIHNWQNIKGTYHAWHVDRSLANVEEPPLEEAEENDTNMHPDMEINEWELLSRLIHAANIDFNELDILGHRDFDTNYSWNNPDIPEAVLSYATQFIETNRPCIDVLHMNEPINLAANKLSHKQYQALNIVLHHSQQKEKKAPLMMIIQGTVGTGKSYMINCIKASLNQQSPYGHSPILLLAPTGVAAFNIQATTIHSALKIPIKNFQPLQTQTLAVFQEMMKHIRYVLIDEMRFIGPKLFVQIESRLREAFPETNNFPFDHCSIILVGDLGQLPPVMDIPLYTCATPGRSLWNSFTTVVTLQTSFHQQGQDIQQVQFRRLLTNIRNASPLQEDWEILQSRTNTYLSTTECKDLDVAIHLFATNTLVYQHNKKMLQSLNRPIARCIAERLGCSISKEDDDHQLEQEILLCIGQRVMLTCNLWIQTGLVNGALGLVTQIAYTEGVNPPSLPAYVVVEFDTYLGPPWDDVNPNKIPIPPIKRGNKKQIPLKMAWGLTIHKSQGLTLSKATINIGKVEQQGLTFTAISRIKSLAGLRISPFFSFDRYAKMQDSTSVAMRKKEEARLHALSL